MSFEIRIDGNANIIVKPDTASTTAKQFLLFLLSQLIRGSDTAFTISSDSDITEIGYDEATHQLTWKEWGNQQSYSMTTDALQSFTAACINQIDDPVAPTDYATSAQVDELKQLVLALPTRREAPSRDQVDLCAKSSELARLATNEDVDEIADKIDGIERTARGAILVSAVSALAGTVGAVAAISHNSNQTEEVANDAR